MVGRVNDMSGQIGRSLLMVNDSGMSGGSVVVGLGTIL